MTDKIFEGAESNIVDLCSSPDPDRYIEIRTRIGASLGPWVGLDSGTAIELGRALVEAGQRRMRRPTVFQPGALVALDGGRVGYVSQHSARDDDYVRVVLGRDLGQDIPRDAVAPIMVGDYLEADDADWGGVYTLHLPLADEDGQVTVSSSTRLAFFGVENLRHLSKGGAL